MQPSNFEHPHFIQTDDELRHYCEQWTKLAMVAVDTEFIRTDTFYPIAALIQISDGSGCFLIDPLVISTMEPLKALFLNANVMKVLHSCSEDLEVFDRMMGAIPQPLFDTQIAAAIDGYGFSLGYQRFVQVMLQIDIAKGETRSNWLRRPLTASQIHYAALDVAYLPAIYQMLQTSLAAKGRESWVQDECQGVVNKFLETNDISEYYKKIKSAWKLSRIELTILQEITQWREQCARARNVPRARVLKDKSCFDIAKLKPRNLSVLSAVEDVTSKMVREDGDSVLALIESAKARPAAAMPESLPRPLPLDTSAVIKSLKKYVSQQAEKLQIAPEILMKKRDYEELIRSGTQGKSYQLPDSLMGWRKAVVGDPILEILSTSASQE